jgi:hypothetical protein
MKIMNESLKTITLEHVLPHETIGELTKRACLSGRIFKVSITVEEPYLRDKQVKSNHPLANYLEKNHPFSGMSDKMNSMTNEIKEGINEKLFDKFAK